jgi:hypothetical protein
LFAATVASFNIELYKTLQPDTGNATVALLSLLTQQVAALSNGTQLASLTSTTPSAAQGFAPFTPSTSSVVINTLWFLSLFLSLLCALFATLIQQWSRQYVHSTQTRGRPHLRGRLQVYLSNGMQSFRIESVVEWMITLLHLALIFFLGGLVAFLFEVNNIVAYTVLALASISFFAYTVLSVLPIFYGDCPYRTPFTPAFRFLLIAPAIVILRSILAARRALVQSSLSAIDRFLVDATWSNYLARARRLWQAEWTMAEHAYPSDERMLRRTFALLDEEHEIALFFDNVHALSRAYDIPVARYLHKNLLAWADFITTLDRLLRSYRDACTQAVSRAHAAERSGACLRFLWRLLTCADRRHATHALAAFLPSCDFFAEFDDCAIALHARCSRALIFNFCLDHLRAGAPLEDERSTATVKQIALALQPADRSAPDKFVLDRTWLCTNGQLANLMHLARTLVPLLPGLPPTHINTAAKTISQLIIQVRVPELSNDIHVRFSQLCDELRRQVTVREGEPEPPPGLVRLSRLLGPLALSMGLRTIV